MASPDFKETVDPKVDERFTVSNNGKKQVEAVDKVDVTECLHCYLNSDTIVTMETTKQITKRQFEEMINEREGFSEEIHGNNKAQKANKRPYGTYIRSADKELFDRSYDRYINTGVYHLSLWDQE